MCQPRNSLAYLFSLLCWNVLVPVIWSMKIREKTSVTQLANDWCNTVLCFSGVRMSERQSGLILALFPSPLMPLPLHVSPQSTLVSVEVLTWQKAAGRVERQERSVVTNNDRGWMNEKAMPKTLRSCWLKLFVFCPGTGRPMSHFGTVASFCYTRAPMFTGSIYNHLNRYRKQ